MRKRMIRQGLLIVGLVLGSFASCEALTITPSRTEVSLIPGEKTKIALTVLNEAAQAVQVDVSEKDWFVLPENKKHPASDWLRIKGAKRFVLEPREMRKVKIVLKAPKDAQGELVGMTSFLYRTEEPSMVIPMISVSVYLALAGTEKVSADISDLTVAPLQDRLRVLATVKNTGNVHVRPSGRLTVISSSGENVHQLTIPDNAAPAYPGSERAYVGEEAALHLKPGAYQVRADLQSRGLTMTAVRDFRVLKDGRVEMSQKP